MKRKKKAKLRRTIENNRKWAIRTFQNVYNYDRKTDTFYFFYIIIEGVRLSENAHAPTYTYTLHTLQTSTTHTPHTPPTHTTHNPTPLTHTPLPHLKHTPQPHLHAHPTNL